MAQFSAAYNKDDRGFPTVQETHSKIDFRFYLTACFSVDLKTECLIWGLDRRAEMIVLAVTSITIDAI